MSRAPEPSTADLPRILGVRDAGRSGPLVIIVAGQHGNEGRGVEAVRELLAELPAVDAEGHGVRGRLVVLTGNRSALRRGVRHQGRDLNRLWTKHELAALAVRPMASDAPDEAELRELHAVLDAELAAAGDREVLLVDVHSTSAGGSGFTIVADALRSRALAARMPLPVVLGLEERLEGPLLTWMAQRGHAAIVLEGGQHEDAGTARTCLAALWWLLAHAKVVRRDHPRLAPAQAHLARTSHGLPAVVELCYVHPVARGDHYVMEPGWRNFMRVRRDQSLALQNSVVVQAPVDGYMLMPLYQGLGAEGYFLCRPVAPGWLALSRLVRRARLELLLWLVPGVRSVAAREGACRTRRRLPRATTAALRLFGFRRRALEGDDGAVWWRPRQ